MNSYSLGMKSIVSEKGQVTIPKAIREKLGLRPGTVLDFEAVQGRLVGRKKEPEDRLGRWLGRAMLPSGLSVDSYLEKVRK